MTDDLKSPGPVAKVADYKTLVAQIHASEVAILKTCLVLNSSITNAGLVGMGFSRRAVDVSSGFRAMVEQPNMNCAMSLVRMQIDTVCRLYSGLLAHDQKTFLIDVLEGKQITRLKGYDGNQMQDKYLVRRVAALYPWISDVYDKTCGYVHFSNYQILEALRFDKTGHVETISLRDFDRDPIDFLEPMKWMLDLNEIIKTALRYWFQWMGDPDGIKKLLCGETDQQARDKPC